MRTQDSSMSLLNTNLDTNFLKIIAVFAMIIDHMGIAFFPDNLWFRLVGRIVFPIFCYCMTVGLLYTHNIKKYLLRIGIFAVISQPFWILAFNQDNFMGNLTNWNIFFTLFVSLVGAWGLKVKKWWVLAVSVLLLLFVNFDYGTTGLFYIIIFYLCRRREKLGAALSLIIMILPSVFTAIFGNADFFIGSIGLHMSITSIFAVPLIYLHTNIYPKINKYFFYIAYPLHLGVIGLIKFFM